MPTIPVSLIDVPVSELSCMNEDQGKMLLACMMCEIGLSESDAFDDLIESDFSAQVLVRRISGNDIDIKQVATQPVIALCSFLSNGNPGRSVMWAWTLVNMAIRNGGPVNIETFTETFAEGFPTERGYEIVWDSQKSVSAPLGNLLDDGQTWAIHAAAFA